MVRLINDATMQAIGSYQGGRMLFLGLGTGLGGTLILEGTVEPMEVGNLPYNISTPLLFHLLDHRAVIQDLHIMLQREVIARMAASLRRWAQLVSGARQGKAAGIRTVGSQR